MTQYYAYSSSDAEQVSVEGSQDLAQGCGEPEPGRRVDHQARPGDWRRLGRLLLRRRRQHLRHQAV